MEVIVRAGWAERYLGTKERKILCKKGDTILSILLSAGLPEDEIGIVEIGGKSVSIEKKIYKNSTLRVYPPIISG